MEAEDMISHESRSSDKIRVPTVVSANNTMGNGAKAQQKRERNADKNAGKKNTSQKGLNEQKKDVICEACRQPFFTTVRQPALEEHVQNKHPNKTLKECFPNYKSS